jgi:hypothetical protein
MSVGLIGVVLSFVLGIVFGGISGFYGGWLDTLIQRVIEILRSIPTIPLWMGLSAALPPNWPPVQVYFGVTVILSLVGWTGLARVVRGRFPEPPRGRFRDGRQALRLQREGDRLQAPGSVVHQPHHRGADAGRSGDDPE